MTDIVQFDLEWLSLLQDLNQFTMSQSPMNESSIEKALSGYLGLKGYFITRQKHLNQGRVDILLTTLKNKRYSIELKMVADISCFEQLDRYALESHGLALVCWTASKRVQKVFELAKKTAKIPMALVQVRNNCKMI